MATDLFGYRPAQASMFEGFIEQPKRSLLPDPQDIRRELTAVLAEARSAKTMPWNDYRARYWQTVFPQMANWLPEAERDQLRFEFAQEIERLNAAA